MNALAGILFHVNPRDTNVRYPVVRFYLNATIVTDGIGVLRYLVPLWKVGIEVVLAREC